MLMIRNGLDNQKTIESTDFLALLNASKQTQEKSAEV